MTVVLAILLGLDALQLLAALAAVAQGRARRARGEERLARYSFRHAALLAAGSLLLAVPMVLGLADVVAHRTAVWIVIAAELAAVVIARPIVERLHRAAHA